MGAMGPGETELRTRFRQQAAVADLGQQALESDDLDQLMRDAVAAVADTLDNEYCKVLELLPSGEALLLRQGVGWREGLVEHATVPTHLDSQAGYTLLTEEPVIVDDLREEERFSGPDLLTSHDVVSGISVVIGSVDDPWGVLGTHSTERRQFTDHDANFVKSVANVLAAAIDRADKEQRLHERESQLNVATAAASIGLWQWDIQEDVVTADEFLAESYGMDPEQVAAGAPMEEFYEPIHEEDTERTWEQLERALETGELEAEYRVRDVDGDTMWVVARGRVEYDADGEPAQMHGAVADITERKRREQALKAREERYRDLFTSMSEGYCVIEKIDTAPGAPIDFRYVEANPAFEEHSGVEDVVGKTIREVVPGEDQEWFDLYASVVQTREPITFERELVTQGRVLECYAFPVGDESEQRVGVLFTDVTDRVERERALEESERRYRALAENFPDGGVGVYDENLRYTLVTGTMWDDIEPDSEDLEGQTIWEALPPDTADDIEPIFRGALKGERGTVISQLGGRTYRVWAVPLRDANGEVTAGQSFALDITDQLKRERQLKASNERLEQFAYAASHDLQEPLRMVSSYLQLIENRYADGLDEEGEEFLEFAVDGADRMREMIDGLLKYSRIESQGKPPEPVDLDAVIDDVIEDLRVRIEESDADITTDSLPLVEGDGGQLRQVFQNLLSNAIEYSGDEPPRVHVSAERDGPWWVISVRDEGIGIKPGDQEQIFEVFHRLHSNEDHPGAGIGLALCERIIERHGGDIWVESEPGEGATFSLTLSAAGNNGT